MTDHFLFRRKSAKGHRTDPVPYPIFGSGENTVSGRFCSECGFDLEIEPRGKFRHLTTRNGAEWLAKK